MFAANNVEVVTKTRTEHMSKEDKELAKTNKNPLLSIFGPSETEVNHNGAAEDALEVTELEYFSDKKMDIGKPKEEFKKGQKFKVNIEKDIF